MSSDSCWLCEGTQKIERRSDGDGWAPSFGGSAAGWEQRACPVCPAVPPVALSREELRARICRAATKGVRLLAANHDPPIVQSVDFAQLAGCPVTTLRKWLTGNWTLAGLATMASALGVEPWELLRRGQEI